MRGRRANLAHALVGAVAGGTLVERSRSGLLEKPVVGSLWEGEVLVPAGIASTVEFWNGSSVVAEAAVEAPECPFPQPAYDCTRVLDESASLSVQCAPGVPGCDAVADECAEGCIRDLWIGLRFTSPWALTELKLRFDWWSKRPTQFEIWSSDDFDFEPAGAAGPLYTGTAATAPYQCVTGESCNDPAVPEDCCPDGRLGIQRIDEGALLPKYDLVTMPPNISEMVVLNVVATQDPWFLTMLWAGVVGTTCGQAGGEQAPPTCDAFGVGNEAGCPVGQWCRPLAALEGGGGTAFARECVLMGDREELEPCQEGAEQCALGHWCSGGRCRRLCAFDGAPGCGSKLPVCSALASAQWNFGYCIEQECTTPLTTDGCPVGTWCFPGEPARCAVAGTKGTGAACEQTEDCAENHRCTWSGCQAMCATEGGGSECVGLAECIPFAAEPVAGFGVCGQACDIVNAPDCAEGQSCIFRTNFWNQRCRFVY